jgi:hypothetical protein
MSNHKHEHCNHNLLYCDKCDVVYCTKCDREWGGHNHGYWYYYGLPYTVRWDNGISAIYTCNTNMKVTDPEIISAYNLQAQTGELSTACTHHN